MKIRRIINDSKMRRYSILSVLVCLVGSISLVFGYSWNAPNKNAVAFAVIKSSGGVVTWGPSYGTSGFSSNSAALSSGVVDIFSTGSAFAALKSDESVYTWGMDGGDSSSVASELTSGVLQIFSNQDAFVAMKSQRKIGDVGIRPFWRFLE